MAQKPKNTPPKPKTVRKSSAGKPKATRPPRKPKVPDRPWARWTLAVILSIAALRLAVNALGLVPIHFDEAQYWAYGHELAAGHFSKPPLVGWLIWAATSIGGDTTFFVRLGAVLCHALIEQTSVSMETIVVRRGVSLRNAWMEKKLG